MASVETVTVSILDKQYQVNCKPEEVVALRESASYLDEKMREVKAGSSVLGLDRIAVMAALNIANDLLSQTRKTEEVVKSQGSQVQTLSTKLDHAIAKLRGVSAP